MIRYMECLRGRGEQARQGARKGYQRAMQVANGAAAARPAPGFRPRSGADAPRAAPRRYRRRELRGSEARRRPPAPKRVGPPGPLRTPWGDAAPALCSNRVVGASAGVANQASAPGCRERGAAAPSQHAGSGSVRAGLAGQVGDERGGRGSTGGRRRRWRWRRRRHEATRTCRGAGLLEGGALLAAAGHERVPCSRRQAAPESASQTSGRGRRRRVIAMLSGAATQTLRQ